MRRCSRCDHSSWHEPAGARRGGRTACPHRLDVDENDRIAAYACAYARPLTSDQHSRTLGLDAAIQEPPDRQPRFLGVLLAPAAHAVRIALLPERPLVLAIDESLAHVAIECRHRVDRD